MTEAQQTVLVCPQLEAPKRLKVGIVYDVVDLRTGECVKGGSTEQPLLKRWQQSPYYGGRGKFIGYGLMEVFRIQQHPLEPGDLFTWRLRVREQRHILSNRYMDSQHLLRNKILPLNGAPDISTLGRIGGEASGRIAKTSGRIQELGFKQGRKNVESGHWARISKLLDRSAAARESGRISVENGWIQALGFKQGRQNVKSGHLARITSIANSAKGGRIGGQTCVETGHIQRIGRAQGQKNVESGHLKQILHDRWHPGISLEKCEVCNLSYSDRVKWSHHRQRHVKYGIASPLCRFCVA